MGRKAYSEYAQSVKIFHKLIDWTEISETYDSI